MTERDGLPQKRQMRLNLIELDVGRVKIPPSGKEKVGPRMDRRQGIEMSLRRGPARGVKVNSSHRHK